MPYIRVVANGAQQAFPVTFPFLDREHITVSVDGVEIEALWTSTEEIVITPTPVSGSVIEIRRNTPASPLVDFAQDAPLGEWELDIVARQGLFLAEEINYRALEAEDGAGGSAAVALAASEVSTQKASEAGASAASAAESAVIAQGAADLVVDWGALSVSADTGAAGTGVQVAYDGQINSLSFVIPQGATGPAGATGPQGPQGPVGATGPQGPQGPAGATGPQGPQGPVGNSAYQQAVNVEGFQGTKEEWLASLRSTIPGPQGPAGATGPQGPQGPQGPKGDKGDPGDASAFLQSSKYDTTAGRLLTVGSFGLGEIGTPTVLADLNATVSPVGFHRVINTTAGAFPAGASPYGALSLERYGPNDLIQTYKPITADAAYHRRYTGGAWAGWQRYLMTTDLQSNTTDATSGKLLQVGSFGVGSNSLSEMGDWDALDRTGFYTDGSKAAVGEPSTYSGMGLMHIQPNPSQATQFAIRSSSSDPQAFLRCLSSGAWSGWTEVLTDRNHPNFFGSRADAIAAEIASPINVIAVLHGGYLLWYRRDPAGDALVQSNGTKWSPATETASFLHWGAAGDGVADDGVAVRKALGSGLALRNPRFMEFRLTAGFLVTVDRVDWEGGVIVYDRTTATSVDGMVIAKSTMTPDNHATCRIREVDFLTKSQWVRWGILVKYSGTPGTVYNHSPNIEFSNIYSGAYVQSNGPGFNPPTQYFSDANIRFVDMHGVHLRSIFCDAQKSSGSTGQPVGTCGIRFGNSSGSTHSYVRIIGQDIHCRALDKGMEFTGSVEGIKLSQIMLVNCNSGVTVNPTDAGGDGVVSYETVGVFITDSHLNCETSCVEIYGAAEVYLSNLELYGFGDTGTWNGIRLGTNNHYVRDFRIYGCTFSGGTGTTTVRNGIKLDQRCDRGKIFDNFGINLTQFCDVSTMTVVGDPVRVRDNEWRNKSNVLQASLATQTSDNTKVSAAWSY